MSAKVIRASSRKRKPVPDNKRGQFLINLDQSDRRALDEASRIEQLPRSEVVRRAVRAYYRRLRNTEQLAS